MSLRQQSRCLLVYEMYASGVQLENATTPIFLRIPFCVCTNLISSGFNACLLCRVGRNEYPLFKLNLFLSLPGIQKKEYRYLYYSNLPTAFSSAAGQLDPFLGLQSHDFVPLPYLRLSQQTSCLILYFFLSKSIAKGWDNLLIFIPLNRPIITLED